MATPEARPEFTSPSEQPRVVVDEFIDFTKRIFSTQDHAVDVEWEHQMNMFWGNPELEQVTKNPLYRGVPGAKDNLISAYEQAGILGIKGAFIQQLVEHQKDILRMGDVISFALEKVVAYKK